MPLPLRFPSLGARASLAASRTAVPQPPVTPRIPSRIEQLGRVRIDDFAWLKPKNWKEVWRDPSRLDPHILAYLEKENRYCDAVLEADRSACKRALVEEMKRHVPETSATPPVPDGTWAYFTRFAAGAQHPTYLRRPRNGGGEQVLLDCGAARRGQALSFDSECDTQSRPPPVRLGRGRDRRREIRHPDQGSCDWRSYSRPKRCLRRLRLFSGFEVSVLDLARSQQPAAPPLIGGSPAEVPTRSFTRRPTQASSWKSRASASGTGYSFARSTMSRARFA